MYGLCVKDVRNWGI